MIFSKVCINFSLALQEGGWVGGRRGGVGEWVRVGWRRLHFPQVNTRGPELPTDGPDHTTRPKGHHSGQG